ncbi:NUDIX hydrolase [Chungangia koreensis]|uniref:NUDIX hydrolase n=1 Tax=Chungangia koreensis TaxID=752657 RepID=A0ABV8X162_9LACT
MRPRANTLGILFKGGKVLLEENVARHSKGYGTYYRPIGGTIELGERSQQALVREFQEELQVEVSVLKSLGCLENIYKVKGRIGHEITLLYTVEFVDSSLYEKESFIMTEGNKITTAKWMDVRDLIEKVVFPDGLIELLEIEFARQMEKV